jgi:membrane protein
MPGVGVSRHLHLADRAWARVARRFAQRWRDDDIGGLAAGMAFYGVLALFPTMLALAATLGSLDSLVGSGLADDVQESVLDWMDRVLTDRASTTRQAVRRLFEQGSGGLIASAGLGALWAGSRGTGGMMRALGRIYDVGDDRPFWRRRLVALRLLAATVLAAAVTLSMFVVGPLFGGGHRLAEQVGLGDTFAWLWRWARLPVAFGALTAWAATVFHLALGRRRKWRRDLVGAAVTATLWVLVSAGLRVYLGVAGAANPVLGALGGALIVLVWLYLLALGLLAGAELNVVLLERGGRPDVDDARQ